MKKRILSAAISALLLGLAAGSTQAEDDVNAWRLFVADHDKPVINVIDALDGDKLATINVKGPASLSRTESGAVVFAIQGSANVVSAISSGIAFHDHGDHADIDIDDAKLLKVELDGKKPGHFVERQGKVAQWFDGESSAQLLTEHALLAGKNDAAKVSVVAAHHGVAVPYDGYAVVSVPDPDDASKRPVGARVVDLKGNKVGEDAACPGLHGSAGSGNLYALSCTTGLLLITQNDNAPVIKHLLYAKSLPEGSTSTLIGGKGMQYFIGNYGPDRLVLIDPTEAESFRLIQLPTRRVHFAVDPVRPKFAWVFTEDGKLNQIDVLKGQITRSVKVTEPYSMDGHWNDPRPRIAVADSKIFVTDPLKSKIHVLDAVALKESGEIAVEGQPFNIVAVGGSGKVHGGGHAHDEHGHSHEHAHSHEQAH
nr:zinc metallochaperone AztD [uncultured Erwinia sp.]